MGTAKSGCPGRRGRNRRNQGRQPVSLAVGKEHSKCGRCLVLRRSSMPRTLMLFFTLAIPIAPAVAQVVLSDSQMAEAMLTEIRALRQDLGNTAATIQRVQIAMYRLQAQAFVVDKAEQRLDQARNSCQQTQTQRKFILTQIDQAEARKQNLQNVS